MSLNLHGVLPIKRCARNIRPKGADMDRPEGVGKTLLRRTLRRDLKRNVHPTAELLCADQSVTALRINAVARFAELRLAIDGMLSRPRRVLHEIEITAVASCGSTGGKIGEPFDLAVATDGALVGVGYIARELREPRGDTVVVVNFDIAPSRSSDLRKLVVGTVIWQPGENLSGSAAWAHDDERRAVLDALEARS